MIIIGELENEILKHLVSEAIKKMAIIPRRLETRVLEECSLNTPKEENMSTIQDKLVKFEQENYCLKQKIQYLENVIQELTREKQNELSDETKTNEIKKKRTKSCLKTRRSNKSLRSELMKNSKQIQRQTETNFRLNKQTNQSKQKMRRKFVPKNASVTPIPCNLVSQIHNTEKELQEADNQYWQLLHKSQAEAVDLVNIHKQMQLIADQIKCKGFLLNELRNKM